MAGKSKDLYTYSKAFFDAAEAAHRGQAQSLRWIMPDARAAISTRHGFNRFRLALTKQGHPHAAAANDLICRIEGNEIVFVPRGLWVPGEEHMDLVVPGIDGASSTPSSVDHTENVMERWLEQGRAPEATEQPIPPGDYRVDSSGVILDGEFKGRKIVLCKHEWDATEAFCLICRRPKE